ncbi:MAG: glucose-1-phosphate thymidylyltransferase [Muribaculaceae bacterium]|nr:glucose-1-phosphate thymidylyltransferase [Muribaculaceae bacterium]
MKLIFFDLHESWLNLLPVTFTRYSAEIRLGIDTIADKWAAALPQCVSGGYVGEEYMSEACEADDGPVADEESLYIAGNVLPDTALTAFIAQGLWQGKWAMKAGERLVAVKGTADDWKRRDNLPVLDIPESIAVRAIDRPYDIFSYNGEFIKKDFGRLVTGKVFTSVNSTNTVIGDASLIYVAPGAEVNGAILNTMHGPIWIGTEAHVMEGACLRGPIAIGDHSSVNMGAKIYPDTTLGPWCKVGGELNNVVMQGYSNKAHDGFLGNAVIGEWCNLGAGCTASNLKNDYTPVKLWNYRTRRFEKTGLQFCGLVMGDHSKAGINTMFNTGTVVGVGCNIHGTGFPRNFIPSFSEGGAAGFTDVQLPKFFDTASRVMARRGRDLDARSRLLFESIFDFADTFK